MTKPNTRHLNWQLLLGLFLLAPIQLGAKGCEVGVVGTDGTGGSAAGGASTGSSATGGATKGGSTSGGAATGGATSTSPKACGARLGDTCTKDQYCKFDVKALCGAADGTGICTAIPDACDGIYSPVCGCDGVTYGNECEAASRDVGISANIPCADDPTTGTSCGGLLGLGCADGEYCDYPIDALCGAADQTGVCAVVPEICTLEYSPVCGCDDKTYGNSCAAAAAGVSVAATGECSTTTTDCGGIAGLTCSKDQYCSFPENTCNVADQMGVCSPIPEACITLYSPVCGCDDKTYGNSCMAAAAGISLATSGECATVTPTYDCGGIAGKTCASGKFCDFPLETRCGNADQMGTCTTIPEVCTEEYVPVCGCDNRTYGNSCAAHSAGVSVAASGICAS